MQFTYGLHDTKLTKIELKDSCIHLIFDGGVYNLDNDGKETSLTSKCVLILKLRESCLWDNLKFTKCRKNRIKEISFDDFSKMLNDSAFDIECDYHSTFDNEILLKGYINKFKIEVVISNIIQHEFLFD